MPKIDYIEVAKALQNKEQLNLPDAEQSTFEQIWEISEQYTPNFDSSAGFEKLNSIINAKSKPKKDNRTLWVAAASILVVLGISVLTLFNAGPTTYATLKGETIDIELDDQSQIKLKGASELILDKEFNKTNRSLNLEGIAHFKVAPDKLKPFIISTAKGKVTVVGTSFTVYADDETKRFALDVFEGKVKVNTNKDETFLTKGMHLELDNEGNAVVSNEDNKLQFTANLFNFKNTPIKDVIIEIENQFGVSVQYDAQISQERITLKTQADNAESLLQIISETLGSEFKTLKQ